MKRATFFKKLLLIMILACLLTAGLSGMIYSVTGIQMNANRIAKEMVPRAYSISRLATRYLNGQFPFDSFSDFAVREQRDSNIYIFDSQGNLVICSEGADTDALLNYLSKYISAVFETGEEVTSTRWRSVAGIVVAVPILDNMGRVNGAVAVSRPRNQVGESMRSLVASLITSCVAALALLILPAYYVSKRISNPIKQMTKVATAMSSGDFTQRADESGTFELGTLGGALNHLSSALNTTIQELVIAKDRLHTILHGLSEGVIAIDEAENITYFNPAAIELLGCAEEPAAILSALQEAAPLLKTVLVDKAPQSMLLHRGQSMLQVTISPSRESIDEKETDAIVLLQDVSEYERLEQTRRDYVANVSHELRTPIASIRSLAEALNDGLIRDEENRSRYYGYILRESLRLTRLINDLLELSRLQSGTIALEKTTFQLDDLIAEVVERMQISASYSGISLNYTPQKLQRVFSNRDRIEQVLVALVDNAVKYADDDGSITVSAEQRDQKAIVSVKNTGHISERDLPHLFERFYKADASHSEGGTGLGLAITKEVLTQLDETIEAANEGGEAVMRFTVSLSDEKFTK